MSPLPGEPGIPNVASRRSAPLSKKGLLAAALLLGSLVAVAAVSLQRFSASGQRSDEAPSRLPKDRPTAASSEPRRLELPPVSNTSSNGAVATRIPALSPTAEELAEPIGVRRTGPAAPAAGGSKVAAPEDAPILLLTTRPGTPNPRSDASQAAPDLPARPDPPDGNDVIAATSRNLQDYQRQLQGLLDKLTRSAALATGQPAEPAPTTPLLGGTVMAGTAPHSAPSGISRPGGPLQISAAHQVSATMQGNRSLTLAKGTAFTCALKTKVISATSGLVGCLVQRNVFGDDGRVLLVERGSHLDGEYHIASLRPGTVRIPVLWTRIRTPLGVTVNIDSPGTGQLGESGIDGYVDNRWSERIGAAMLLSLIDDSVKLVIQNQTSERQADTIVLPSTTANTSKLAEKVLESTINIPPLIYQNQGGIVGIYVARDVDFSSVYELKPTAVAPQREGTP